DPECTPQVLDLLAKYDVRATFFVIGQKAVTHKEIVAAMMQAGHGIGNHTSDHNTMRYFTTPQGMHAWLTDSEGMLSKILGGPSVGFRSPAGIRTPLLHITLGKLKWPWLHWSMRFYDTSFGWPLHKARKASGRIQAGDIILLHD